MKKYDDSDCEMQKTILLLSKQLADFCTWIAFIAFIWTGDFLFLKFSATFFILEIMCISVKKTFEL